VTNFSRVADLSLIVVMPQDRINTTTTTTTRPTVAATATATAYPLFSNCVNWYYMLSSHLMLSYIYLFEMHNPLTL